MKRPEAVAASLVSPTVQLVESVLLFLVPHGGQRTARLNAWSQVAANKQAATHRDELGRYSRPLRLVASTGS
jgi:hypothetical protein